MSKWYEQFLGAKPGLLVEIVDDSGSPFRVRTKEGFEFFVAGDDFRNYYREEGSTTPPRWNHLLTDQDRGIIESKRMALAIAVIHAFEDVVQDYHKARSLVQEALALVERGDQTSAHDLRQWLEQAGFGAGSEDRYVDLLLGLPDDVKHLLLEDSCAVAPLLGPPTAEAVPTVTPPVAATEGPSGVTRSKPVALASAQVPRQRMKNVELSVDGDVLTISVDLSKEFGPSKSGKTIIVASTEGSKTVPGRRERIGLNVYRQPDKKAAKGRKSEFKNVVMEVSGDILTLTVDLSKDFGPSKSGKTSIVASTEGNHLVLGREEKIGLNIYRTIE